MNIAEIREATRVERRAARARVQWIKVTGGSLRCVPSGKLPEDMDIDMRMCVEAEREPLFGEWVRKDGTVAMVQAVRDKRFLEAKRNRREWHDDVDRQLEELRAEVARLRSLLEE